ncbi:MAG: T9SS type A sorting domain-containing protein [Saprospiraceae bacterium]|nr:T9SS type A sorting domain-containing protein [Saprospiraceae bacterium]
MKTFTRYFFLLFVLHQSLYAQPGSLDNGFGNGGIIITNISGTSNDFASSTAIQPDGKILVGGTTSTGSTADFAVVRYLADGNLDPDFGTDGIATIDFNNRNDQATKLLLQADGGIVVAGNTSNISGSDLALCRLLPNGSLDPAFGTGGQVITDVTTGYDLANAAMLQSDGKIVVAGASFDLNTNIIMVRFLSDGSLDTGFGTGGKVITNIFEEDQALDIAQQPDGKIVVTGFASVSAIGDFALLRYHPNGDLDTDFGLDATGIVTLDVQGFAYSDLGKSVAVLPDGSIVVAGWANYYNLTQSADIGLAKFDANGLLVGSFGTGGVVIHDIGNVTEVNAMSVLPSGTIILAGRTDEISNQNQWMLLRLLPNGDLDPSFGSMGLVATSLSGPRETILGLALQSDSKLVAVGKTGETSSANFAVARYFTGIVPILSPQTVGCPDGTNSEITVAAEGGVPPYEYSLDGVNYSSSGVFTDLMAGAYTVYIKDATGEIVTTGISIVAPVAPSVSVVIGANNITINVTGGTGPFVYSFDGGANFQSSNVFEIFSGTTLPVVVMDANGCVVYNDMIFIDANQEVQAGAGPIASVLPNPNNGRFNLRLKSVKSNKLDLIMTDLTGRVVGVQSISGNMEDLIELDYSFLNPGMYQLQIIDGEQWSVAKVQVIK